MELLVFLYTSTLSIPNDSYIDLSPHDGWGFSLNVRADDYIHEIKSKIHEITKIPPDDQHRWVFPDGKDVAPKNDDLLCDYEISDAGSDDIRDALIHAVIILTADFEHRRLHEEAGPVKKWRRSGSADVEQ